ncbi:class I SAM-dependent methyltransferase [Hansschlegelia zhihuaiae]|uniref:Class I SAM-dependent methyltransferase n=1 Tax=Hansschlegelia zhihuaiae TaxID=405005 RepID=A0A4Q0ML99_9HYPH|nr:class I SAM-dependent methyltransferase [Hansschlegelia zhihuaiae]RXF74454.1 class I SAM-dependent methyltransferase [Hansschlegelia zhihuaiae]
MKESQFIELRRQKKAAMPRVLLSEHHTEQCRVLPDRKSLLHALPKGGVVAEIGVAFGDFSKLIWQLSKPAKLHLIDAWQGDRYAPGLTAIKKEFAGPISYSGISIHQGLSIDVIRQFPENYFDWVYIDTNHQFDTTYDELVIASSKVRDAGIIAGHDFCTGNVVGGVPYGVIEACNKFCVDHNWSYRYITLESHGHFSFALTQI